MSVRVISQSNIFSTERKIQELTDVKNINDICKELKINKKTTAVKVSVNGVKITNFRKKVTDGDLVLIKVVPTGGDQLGETLLGGAIIALGIVALAIPIVGTAVGTAAIMFGAGVIFQDEIVEGVKSLFTEATSDSYLDPDTRDANYIRGGVNSIAPDNVVPVILGKHRYYPHQIAYPYTVFDTNTPPIDLGGDVTNLVPKEYTQKIHQLYLHGHKDVLPITETYKRGDTPITDLIGTEIIENSVATYGTTAKKFLNIGKNLKKYVRNVNNANDGFYTVKVILPSNITKADLTLIFGSFYLINNDGKGLTPKTTIRYELFDNTTDTTVTTEDVEIKGPVINPGDNAVPTVINLTTGTTLDPTHNYIMYVGRLSDDPTDSLSPLYRGDNIHSWAIDVQFTQVLCYGSTETITTDADSLFNYVDLTLADVSTDEGGESILTGDINDFNVVEQTHVLAYSGTGTGPTAWSVQPTSNPASMFLYVLQGQPNKRPVSDGLIDWVSLEKWYTFCEDNSYECNMVLNNPGTIQSIISTICLTGRAAPYFADTYGVVVDTVRDYPTQMFTNKNSFGISNTRILTSDVHSVEYSFINEDNDLYIPDTRIVYKEGYDENNATLNISQEVVGVTNPDQVWALGKYKLNCTERRLNVLNVTMDVEYVLCQAGDLVTVSYDELVNSLARGRVKDIVESAPGTITGFVLDEDVIYETGKDYGIIIRLDTGEQTISLPLVNTEDTTNTITLVTPLVGVELKAGDLYTFGEAGKEKSDYIVVSVAPSTELTAQISLIDYAPEVYTLGPLPPWESNISLPANFGPSLILEDIYSVNEIALQTQQEVTRIDLAVGPGTRDAIRASVPSASLIRDDALELGINSENLYFVDKDDLQLYRTTTLQSASKDLVIAESIKNFVVDRDNTYVIYSSLETENKLYKYVFATDTTTQVTDVMSDQPKIVDEDTIVYINIDDGSKVYQTQQTDSLVGTLVIDYAVKTLDFYSGIITYMNTVDMTIYNKQLSDVDVTFPGEVVRVFVGNYIVSTPPALWNNNTDSVVPLYIDPDTNISYTGNEAYYGNVSRHAMSEGGEYVFVDADGFTYYSSLKLDITQAKLDVEVTDIGGTDIPCELIAFDNKVYGISVEDIDSFAWNDDVTGLGIQPDTKVTFVGPDYIIMSNYATVTNASALISVTGTRLLLNANKVVVPGTIEARLMATNAINSLDRVPEGKPNAGEQLYQHDLTTGVEKVFNKEGELVKEVDVDGNITFYKDATFGGDVIIQSDDYDRTVELGSKGLLVTDSGGRIVHDLPASSATGLTYLGHAYQMDAWQDTILFDTNPITYVYQQRYPITTPEQYIYTTLEVDVRFRALSASAVSATLFIQFFENNVLVKDLFIPAVGNEHYRGYGSPSWLFSFQYSIFEDVSWDEFSLYLDPRDSNGDSIYSGFEDFSSTIKLKNTIKYI